LDSIRSSPAVLLHHDGELADVRRLLEDVGAPFVERVGAAEEHERTATWDVIIASPRRILHFRPGATACSPTRIAVLDGDSRTLRAHLRRMRVEWMVRRPVHPAALRLLLLHVLYRGPERRRRRRVSVGAAVRVRAGLLGRSATLTDFSTRGCRLLARSAIARGRRVRLTLPGRVTGGRALRLKATVVRSAPASRRDPGLFVMALRFAEPGEALRLRLEQVLARHATGPATLPQQPVAGAGAGHAVAREGDAQAGPGATTDGSATPRSAEAEPASLDAPVADAPRAAGAGDRSTEPAEEDRRRDSRHAYDRRIVALGDAATRVLLGRDISLGGMRIDAHSGLRLGDRLRIALHAGGRSEPVMIDATVQRDDGVHGLVLGFGEVAGATRAGLEGLIAHLPVLAMDDDGDTATGLVVSEIVERDAG
jgi:hypothetical protein